MSDDKDDISRPITLYVEAVNTHPDIVHTEHRRLSVIDIEMTHSAAQELANYLAERTHDEVHVAVRVRLTGRLVLS